MLFKPVLGLIISILAVTFVANCFLPAQARTSTRSTTDLAALQLENVHIKTQSIGSLFSTLALAYNIPINLEIASKEEEFPAYTIDFKKGTLRELLTEFVTQHNQYDWVIRDDVVNIFPKEIYRDPLFHNLLETRITRFSVKENTSCWALANSLIATPEVKSVLETNGTTYRAANFTGAYIPQLGRHFTLDVSNLTLKSILDRVIRQSATARFWLITWNSDGSLNIGLAALHEDFLKSKAISDFYKIEDLP